MNFTFLQRQIKKILIKQTEILTQTWFGKMMIKILMKMIKMHLLIKKEGLNFYTIKRLQVKN